MSFINFIEVQSSGDGAWGFLKGGSDPTAAGGGGKEESEWQRSTDAKALRRRRQMSGTATGIASRAGRPAAASNALRTPSDRITLLGVTRPSQRRYRAKDIG